LQHLVGRTLPDVALASTSGDLELLARIKGRAVIFCYPWTGRPGHANPPDWDTIPGAHGSTPQAEAYSMACERFRNVGVKLFGLSMQDSGWQQEFATRHGLMFPLLSDAERKFSTALGLPSFTAGATDYLKRLTLITRDGVIEAVKFPVPAPEKDAGEILAMFKESQDGFLE
jgi:peroxiredoxin